MLTGWHGLVVRQPCYLRTLGGCISVKTIVSPGFSCINLLSRARAIIFCLWKACRRCLKIVDFFPGETKPSELFPCISNGRLQDSIWLTVPISVSLGRVTFSTARRRVFTADLDSPAEIGPCHSFLSSKTQRLVVRPQCYLSKVRKWSLSKLWRAKNPPESCWILLRF